MSTTEPARKTSGRQAELRGAIGTDQVRWANEGDHWPAHPDRPLRKGYWIGPAECPLWSDTWHHGVPQWCGESMSDVRAQATWLNLPFMGS